MPRQTSVLTSRLASSSGIRSALGVETQYRALTWALPTSEMASSLDYCGGRSVSSAITSAMASAMSLLTFHNRDCT